MQVINGSEPIFHLFEVYTGNISSDQNKNSTREVYGTLKWVRTIHTNEIHSPIGGSKFRDKGGTISFDVAIYEETIGNTNTNYDDVNYNYTFWKDIVMNQLTMTKNKTYFVCTTKGRNQYEFTETLVMKDTARPTTAKGGFVEPGSETMIPSISNHAPHMHGWLTGIDSTQQQDKYKLTFTNWFGLLENTIADTSLAYVSNQHIDQNDVRTEAHNNITYDVASITTNGYQVGYLPMVGEVFKGITTPTINRNGLPTFNKYNFGEADFYNRNMSTIKKIDERIYAGLDYDNVCRNAYLPSLMIDNSISMQKYGQALDVLMTATQSQGRVEITPDIVLVPSTQPGATGHPHYQFHADLFPAPCTRNITLRMNQVDIQYNTLGGDYATNIVVQDLNDDLTFAEGYQGWLYSGELGYPVVRYLQNNVDTTAFPNYPSASAVQQSMAVSELVKRLPKYINIAVKEEDDINFGNDTYDNEYFEIGDKINITVEELKSTFTMVIVGKVMYIDPQTFTETYNFVLERLE